MINSIKQISLAVTFSSMAVSLMAADADSSATSNTFVIPPMDIMAEKETQTLSATTKYAQALAASLAKIQTLKIDFKQTSIQANGHKKEQSGHITLLKPSHFEILMDAPWAQKIVNNGLYQWDYDIDLEEVHKTPILAEQKGSIIDLLSVSSTELSELYTVSIDSRTNDTQVYRLVPKESDSFSEFVLISLKNDLPNKMMNRDPLGNDSIFEFSGAELNPVVDPSYFDFKVPEGVDVYE